MSLPADRREFADIARWFERELARIEDETHTFLPWDWSTFRWRYTASHISWTESEIQPLPWHKALFWRWYWRVHDLLVGV